MNLYFCLQTESHESESERIIAKLQREVDRLQGGNLSLFFSFFLIFSYFMFLRTFFFNF